MSDELKRRRPPPTAYDDPVAGDADTAIKHLAQEIRAGSNRIAGAIEKLAEAMVPISKSEAD
jgi:hypothetical protein